jgi:hypothetical protein
MTDKQERLYKMVRKVAEVVDEAPPGKVTEDDLY